MSNRLAAEASPYLRQHAENPVDWYPWGAEAFERARAEDRPILLSVGYSACHWCHVMAHESFEDPQTAAVMNELFLNVKVDREERPDVDAIYMEAVQAMTGQGGWPMTVFLTPDGRPFYGGTYFPVHPRPGMPGFVQVCQAVDRAWRERRPELSGVADRLTEAIGRSALLSTDGGEVPGGDVLEAASTALSHEYDPRWGGFGRAPKFPRTDSLELLLSLHVRHGGQAPDALAMVTTTLDAMASGGIYDHLEGGFHRYSVDAFWMVPHFEKMLYDQAQCARVYLHAWQLTGEARYLQVLTETIGYVLSDLRHGDGGFFSAEDADSEGEEGKFYVWRLAEIESLLGEAAPAVVEWYGASRGGNFEGANILHRPVRGDLLRPPEIEHARQALLAARSTRVRPGLDDKVLTEWNALFISMLAEAAAATGRADWLSAAVAGAEFLWAALRQADGRWLRSWQAEHGARHLAFATDYAALTDAFTRLGEATGEAHWTQRARQVADAMLDLFWDSERGGLFTTGHDAEQLVARAKDVIDNVTPAANSAASRALLRLAALTGEERYHQRATDIVRALATPLTQHPTAFCHLLGAVDLLVSGATEVVVTGSAPELVRAVHERYLPTAVLAWGEPYPSPLWEGREAQANGGAAYVCRRYACQMPVTTVEALIAQL